VQTPREQVVQVEAAVDVVLPAAGLLTLVVEVTGVLL
jgi:hypothetical protein